MYTFPELIKQIRNESELTQTELARVLGVSPILISKVETGRKEVSKGLVKKLAEKLEISAGTLFPFIFIDQKIPLQSLSRLERQLIDLGSKMQSDLIKTRSKKLKKYAKK